MKVIKFFTVIFLFVFLGACEEEVSKGILTENEMLSILVDYNLATELVGMAHLSKDSSSMYMQQIYKPAVLERHQVTGAVFDESYRYYLSKPKVFTKMQGAIADSLKVRHLKGSLDF